MTSDAKLDSSFPEDQFHIDGYSKRCIRKKEMASDILLWFSKEIRQRTFNVSD